MKLNLREVPFSTAGSYFSIAVVNGQLMLKDVHGGHETPANLFQLFIEGEGDIYHEDFQQKYDLTVCETELRCSRKDKADSYLKIVYNDDYGLRFYIKDLSLEMVAVHHMYNTFYKDGEHIYEFISYKKDQHYGFDFLAGDLQLKDETWDKIQNKDISLVLAAKDLIEFDLNYYKVAPAMNRAYPTYQQLLTNRSTKLAAFRKNFQHHTETEEFNLATYLLWSNRVEAEGQLTEPCIYMSKNWMQNIWSWDNCFSAIALAKTDPESAYGQLKIFIDHQSPEGAFPDFINDKTISFSCVKPPIHAWAYQEMMDQNPLFKKAAYLLPIYDGLSKNTAFWLNHRRNSLTDLLYYSHGNDSGWDNATVFHEGMAVSSPDLVAFLAKQTHILANWANEIVPSEESYWRDISQGLVQELLEKYYVEEEEQFVARHARTGQEIAKKDSLILRMPLFAGELLPEKITAQLAAQLETRFETTFGIATEAPDSSDYVSDGYWLGPIWAPVNYMLIDSLKKNGFEEFAARLGKKYLHLTQVGGMAENYDALTGKGNDDLGFAWASAVYVLLNELFPPKSPA